MLQLHIPEREMFNEETYDLITIPETDLRLEHSLISLSRWESKWKKPFLTLEKPTQREFADYICCMSVDKNIDMEFALNLNANEYEKIRDYIGDPFSATKIYDRSPNQGKKEIYTAEIIYYWMIYFGIPFSCEKWHLNKLLTLIRVCSVKGGTSQQMDMNAIFAQNGKLNAARRAARMSGK